MKKLLPLILALFLLATPALLLAADDATTTPMDISDESYLDDPFADEVAPLTIYDPIEPVNRGFFWFNDKLYFYLLKPVARVWRVTPEPARISVSNVFSNLATPVRFVGSLLQLKFKAAGTELYRLIVNSTVGLGGLFDPAGKIGLEKKDEDLGQTFGYYGAGSGPYLVLPLLGPSNLRDGIGRVGDSFLSPLSYALGTGESLAARGVDVVNELSLDKDTYESIKKNELDPYLFIRSAYEQNRAAKISE